MRRKKGYALVSTMVIGCSAIAFLMALSGYVMADMQTESKMKHSTVLSSAAEAGLDYAIHRFNTDATCALDVPVGETETPWQDFLPTDYLQASYLTSSNYGNKIEVKLRVRKLTPMQWSQIENFSTIYNAQLDPSKNKYQNGNPPDNNLSDDEDYWRVLECRATVAGRSKTLRSILQPVLSAPLLTAAPPTTFSSIFQNPLFANTNLEVASANSGTLTVSGVDSNGTSFKDLGGFASYQLNAVSNKQATLGAGSEIQGNLLVSGTTDQDLIRFPNPHDDGTPAATVDGRLQTNGQLDLSGATASPNEAKPQTTDNVRADADIAQSAPSRLGDNLSSPINTTPLASTYSSPTFSGVNTAPLSLSTFQAMDAPLTPGDYVTSGLNTDVLDAGSNPVRTTDSVPSGDPTAVRIYVKEPSSGSSEAIKIDANMFQNGTLSPQNLQIFYAGKKDIIVSLGDGGSFSGLIYAPSAKVQTTGTNGNFTGAIASSELKINHSGTLKLLTDLNDSGNSLNRGLFQDTSNSTAQQRGWRWKPVTWEEVK